MITNYNVTDYYTEYYYNNFYEESTNWEEIYEIKAEKADQEYEDMEE